MEEYFMNKDHSDRFLLLANELKFANFEDSEWRTAIFLISSSEKWFCCKVLNLLSNKVE